MEKTERRTNHTVLTVSKKFCTLLITLSIQSPRQTLPVTSLFHLAEFTKLYEKGLRGPHLHDTGSNKMVKKPAKTSLVRTRTTKGSSGKHVSIPHLRHQPSQSASSAVAPLWPIDLLSLSRPPPQGRNAQAKTTLLSLEVLHPQTVYVARNFLTPAECQAWIDHVNNNQLMEYVSHPASRTMAHRECSRWQCNDWSMADRIFQRIQTTIPIQDLDFGFGTIASCNRNSSTDEVPQQPWPIACNGNLRIYQYDKGMRFGRHVDDSNDTERGMTQVTVLIYLSDCQGGGTRFHLTNATTRTSATTDVVFEPQVGAILFHVHGEKCLEHEADPVLSGTKFVLRTDLVYPSKRR